MNIRNTKFNIENSKAVLSADIYENEELINNIFIRVDQKYASLIRKDATAFVPMAYFASSRSNQKLIIEDPVSQALYNNLSKVGSKISEWDMGFKNIETIADDTNHLTQSPSITAAFFTAGVDSFYTYLKHRDDIDSKLTHLIFTHGFDIPLHDNVLFDQVISHLKKVADEEKRELIIVETNLREFLDKYVEWEMSHGSALGSIAQFLGNGLKTIYIPGTTDEDNMFPLGSHPDIDPLWSSETTQIIHDGLESSRLGKIKNKIAKSKLALEHLRVCYSNYGGKYNCSKCNKCLRTMVLMAAVGALEDSKTFILPLDLSAVSKISDIPTRELRHYRGALTELTERNENPALQNAVRSAIKNILNPDISIRIKRAIKNIDTELTGGHIFRYAWYAKKRLSNLI